MHTHTSTDISNRIYFHKSLYTTINETTMIKLHSFINTFHQLWKAGETAHLDLNTHAGQAWIGIRTPLGYYGQTHQHNHNIPQTHHTHTQHPPPHARHTHGTRTAH